MEQGKKKMNRNAIRSVNMIVKAYTDLLKELPEERITVTAIVTRAGLNRSTFYAHFGCPEDVHKLLEEEFVTELFEKINEQDIRGLLDNPKPILQIVSDLIETRKEYLRISFNKNYTSSWMDGMREAVIDKFIAAAEEASDWSMERDRLIINLRFFIGGYVSLCRDYILNKTEVPLRELTDILSDTIAGGIAAKKN